MPTAGPAAGDSKSSKISVTRWQVLGCICIGTFAVNYAADAIGSVYVPMKQFMAHDDFDFYFQCLYSVYSWPNLILPLVAGIYISRVGIYSSMFFLSSCVAIGTVVVYYGCRSKSWYLMLLGRILFGIGGESNCVAQNVLLVSYFGQAGESAFAMALMIACARIGSSVTSFIGPWICAHHLLDGPVWALFLASAICCVGSLMNIVAVSHGEGPGLIAENIQRRLSSMKFDPSYGGEVRRGNSQDSNTPFNGNANSRSTGHLLSNRRDIGVRSNEVTGPKTLAKGVNLRGHNGSTTHGDGDGPTIGFEAPSSQLSTSSTGTDNETLVLLNSPNSIPKVRIPKKCIDLDDEVDEFEITQTTACSSGTPRTPIFYDKWLKQTSGSEIFGEDIVSHNQENVGFRGDSTPKTAGNGAIGNGTFVSGISETNRLPHTSIIGNTSLIGNPFDASIPGHNFGTAGSNGLETEIAQSIPGLPSNAASVPGPVMKASNKSDKKNESPISNFLKRGYNRVITRLKFGTTTSKSTSSKSSSPEDIEMNNAISPIENRSTYHHQSRSASSSSGRNHLSDPVIPEQTLPDGRSLSKLGADFLHSLPEPAFPDFREEMKSVLEMFRGLPSKFWVLTLLFVILSCCIFSFFTIAQGLLVTVFRLGGDPKNEILKLKNTLNKSAHVVTSTDVAPTGGIPVVSTELEASERAGGILAIMTLLSAIITPILGRYVDTLALPTRFLLMGKICVLSILSHGIILYTINTGMDDLKESMLHLDGRLGNTNVVNGPSSSSSLYGSVHHLVDPLSHSGTVNLQSPRGVVVGSGFSEVDHRNAPEEPLDQFAAVKSVDQNPTRGHGRALQANDKGTSFMQTIDRLGSVEKANVEDPGGHNRRRNNGSPQDDGKSSFYRRETAKSSGLNGPIDVESQSFIESVSATLNPSRSSDTTRKVAHFSKEELDQNRSSKDSIPDLASENRKIDPIIPDNDRTSGYRTALDSHALAYLVSSPSATFFHISLFTTLVGIALSGALFSASCYSAFSLVVTNQKQVGSAYGVSTAAQNLGMAIAPLLVGKLMHDSHDSHHDEGMQENTAMSASNAFLLKYHQDLKSYASVEWVFLSWAVIAGFLAAILYSMEVRKEKSVL